MNKTHKLFTLAKGSTHTTNFADSRNNAFTLAEVLITLVIIGVVAAMTLPTLIQHYKERQRVAQVKKIYSLLNQAYLRAREKYGLLTL